MHRQSSALGSPAWLRSLRARYAAFDHPGAREIVAFLDGEYRITREMMEAV